MTVMLLEKRICLYHGPEWLELMSQGWQTHTVDDVTLPDGPARIAVMVRQRPLTEHSIGTYLRRVPHV